MIPYLRVCVRLPYTIAYGSAGQECKVAGGTPLDWVDVIRIGGSIDLVPGDEYESLQGSPIHYCVWAGSSACGLRQDQVICVAVLQHESGILLVPIEELPVLTGNDWDSRIAILAWEQAKLAPIYELARGLVIDDDATAP
jgi:hypothetical protein